MRVRNNKKRFMSDGLSVSCTGSQIINYLQLAINKDYIRGKRMFCQWSMHNNNGTIAKTIAYR